MLPSNTLFKTKINEKRQLQLLADEIHTKAIAKVHLYSHEISTSYDAFLLLAAIHELVIQKKRSFPTHQFAQMILKVNNNRLQNLFKELKAAGYIGFAKNRYCLTDIGTYAFTVNSLPPRLIFEIAPPRSTTSMPKRTAHIPHQLPFWRKLKPPVVPTYTQFIQAKRTFVQNDKSPTSIQPRKSLLLQKI